MKPEKYNLLVKDVPEFRSGQSPISEAVEPVTQAHRLSPEFFDRIYDWDPGAANDDYYVTSPDFIELHSQIKRTLIRGVIWWATSVCLGMPVLVFVFR